MRAALTLSAATWYANRPGMVGVEHIAGEMAWVEARELLARNRPAGREVVLAGALASEAGPTRGWIVDA